jgi:hypothetical protein
MQPSQANVGAFFPVVVRDHIRPECIGDIYLYDHQVRLVIQIELFHVLVLQPDVIIGRTIGWAARVASPRGGNNEYLMGRQKGLLASISAGRIIFTFITAGLIA